MLLSSCCAVAIALIGGRSGLRRDGGQAAGGRRARANQDTGHACGAVETIKPNSVEPASSGTTSGKMDRRS
jgi:hypothetical protein